MCCKLQGHYEKGGPLTKSRSHPEGSLKWHFKVALEGVPARFQTFMVLRGESRPKLRCKVKYVNWI